MNDYEIRHLRPWVCGFTRVGASSSFSFGVKRTFEHFGFQFRTKMASRTLTFVVFSCIIFYATCIDLSASDQTSSQWVLELNKPKSIPCPLSYDTSANITWFKGNTVLNVTNTRYSLWENNTLFIEKAVDEDAGVYTCVIGYGSPNAKNISYTLTTRARVQSFPKSMNMVQGDRLKLNCTVYGYPVPTITWLKDDTPLSDLNLTSRIKLSPDSRNVSDAILVIEHLEDDDRANYYCVASNDVNTVNTTVMVRVKDKLAALWPFLGILAEVAVLCTIIFIYEKRRAKQEYDESDTDQNNENKPVSDQKEKDVRQRK